jgi:hypothetical protein
MARVARGDCQREVAEAAATDGIELGPQSFDWLCQRGHFALPEDTAVRAVLAEIFAALDGDPQILSSAGLTRLPGDFVHVATGTLVEVDEHQHFTSARMTSLRLYPDDAPLGFSSRATRRSAPAGNARPTNRSRIAKRPRSRVRMAVSASARITTRCEISPRLRWGTTPLIRIDAALDNGRAAYAKHRERLMALLAPQSTQSS